MSFEKQNSRFYVKVVVRLQFQVHGRTRTYIHLPKLIFRIQQNMTYEAKIMGMTDLLTVTLIITVCPKYVLAT